MSLTWSNKKYANHRLLGIGVLGFFVSFLLSLTIELFSTNVWEIQFQFPLLPVKFHIRRSHYPRKWPSCLFLDKRKKLSCWSSSELLRTNWVLTRPEREHHFLTGDYSTCLNFGPCPNVHWAFDLLISIIFLFLMLFLEGAASQNPVRLSNH